MTLSALSLLRNIGFTWAFAIVSVGNVAHAGALSGQREPVASDAQTLGAEPQTSNAISEGSFEPFCYRGSEDCYGDCYDRCTDLPYYCDKNCECCCTGPLPPEICYE
jgi:hypothetical protein